MTSEGTKSLILTFTSKSGQPIERTRYRIFKFGFIFQRGRYIKAVYRPYFRLQTLRVLEV